MSGNLPRPKIAFAARWVSVCLLLAVSFLPLHFHATSPIASQIAKECICLHGSRTQANLISTAIVCAPVVIVCTPVPVTQLEFVSLAVGIPSSRAPPV
jgi:hypothetical protein